jgi:hypothetical protein
MNPRYAIGLLSLTVGLMAFAGAGPGARAQEPAQPKDEALDSLLEKLSSSSDGRGAKAEKSAKAKGSKSDKDAKAKGKSSQKAEASRGSDSKARSGGASGSRAGAAPSGKPAAPKPGGSSAVSGKDKDLDDLLEKLGETKDAPTPDERPRGGPGGDADRQGRPPARPGQAERNQPAGKDKDLDQHLEELTGRRRKRNGDDGQRTGKVGEIIKEMRDVEQKLGKPDTSEGTREEQKRIVKNIDTLIEEIRKSGGTMRGLVFRRARQRGQQQSGGQQQGQTRGAQARGVGPSKPLQPTGKHANVGGKDIWGHLPAELRQEIENQTQEEALSAKKELVDRYYLSVGKGKLVREE